MSPYKYPVFFSYLHVYGTYTIPTFNTTHNINIGSYGQAVCSSKVT